MNKFFQAILDGVTRIRRADDPKYRWYSLRRGGMQRNGFFVDDTDRILFWLDKTAHGYVLDKERAQQILKMRQLWAYPLLTIGFSLTLIPLLGGRNRFARTYEGYDGYLSVSYKKSIWLQEYFSESGFVALGLIISFIVFRGIRAIYRRWKIIRIVAGCEIVDCEMPRPDILKPSERVTWPLWSKLLFCVLLLSSLTWLLNVMQTSEHLGNQLVAGGLGLALLYYIVRGIIWQLEGVRWNDVQ